MTDYSFHNDSRTAFLFHCSEDDLFAVSLDKTDANVATALCAGDWRLRDMFRLGVHEAMPIAFSSRS